MTLGSNLSVAGLIGFGTFTSLAAKIGATQCAPVARVHVPNTSPVPLLCSV